MTALPLLRLAPQYRDYVWGGDRLRPGNSPIAEAWILYEGDTVQDGPLAGQTLKQIAASYGETLLGSLAIQNTGLRFPLLIKLLDCQQWLSLQVHPNDEQARALEGPGVFGKTEAWYVIEAARQAEILCGFKHPLNRRQLEAALRSGKAILDHIERLPMHTGDTLLLTPGTVHALGPGLLIYEVQQTSDITYRVYDWDRPASEGRELHLEQSLEVLNTGAGLRPIQRPAIVSGTPALLTRSKYFALWLLGGTEAIAMDTKRESFHAITAIDGDAVVNAGSEQAHLRRFETILIPASTGAYQVSPQGEAHLLAAMVNS